MVTVKSLLKAARKTEKPRHVELGDWVKNQKQKEQ